MTEHYDVAIVGGAVMGSSTAHFLAENPDFDGRVIVLEKDSSYSRAASSRSTSGFRQQFSSPVNILLSRYSAEFIKSANIMLRVDGQSPGLDIFEHGYLYLGGTDMVDAFVANNEIQRGMGASVRLLDRDELRKVYPWLNVDDVEIGSLGESGEGWFDGYMLMNAFRRSAQHRGVTYLYQEVCSLERQPRGEFGLTLADGTRMTADRVVNCAGTGAPAIATMLGLSVPVSIAKQNVFNFESPLKVDRMPYVFTPDGLFCRPEGGGYIAGTGIETDDTDVDPADMEADCSLFDTEVWPRLAFRVSAFEEARFKGGWAGHYDMSNFDHNPFIGAIDQIPNFYLASGFSGHGIMQSPGVGLSLSELIIYGGYRTLDLSPLGFDRIALGRPMFERIQY